MQVHAESSCVQSQNRSLYLETEAWLGAKLCLVVTCKLAEQQLARSRSKGKNNADSHGLAHRPQTFSAWSTWLLLF